MSIVELSNMKAPSHIWLFKFNLIKIGKVISFINCPNFKCSIPTRGQRLLHWTLQPLQNIPSSQKVLLDGAGIEPQEPTTLLLDKKHHLLFNGSFRTLFVARNRNQLQLTNKNGGFYFKDTAVTVQGRDRAKFGEGIANWNCSLVLQSLPSVPLLHSSIFLVINRTAQWLAFHSPSSKFPGKGHDWPLLGHVTILGHIS